MEHYIYKRWGKEEIRYIILYQPFCVCISVLLIVGFKYKQYLNVYFSRNKISWLEKMKNTNKFSFEVNTVKASSMYSVVFKGCTLNWNVIDTLL